MQQQDLFLDLGPNCSCHADSPVYLRVVTEREILWIHVDHIARHEESGDPAIEYSSLVIHGGVIARREPRYVTVRGLPSIPNPFSDDLEPIIDLAAVDRSEDSSEEGSAERASEPEPML